MNHEFTPVILDRRGAARAVPVPGREDALNRRMPGRALWRAVGLI